MHRKPPQCRTCGQPMKGHRSCSGGTAAAAASSVSSISSSSTVTEQDDHSSKTSAFSYASPPPTPPPVSFRSEDVRPPPPKTYPIDIMSEPSFVIPETGYFHRRNPRYVHPPPKLDLPCPTRSVTPTVIVGPDGRSIAPSVRSSSPTLSESSVTSDFSVTTVIASPSNTPSRTEEHTTRYEYFSNGGTTLIRGFNWQEKDEPQPPTTTGLTRLRERGLTRDAVSDVSDELRCFVVNLFVSCLKAFWNYAPQFAVTFAAAILGGYVCKTYL